MFESIIIFYMLLFLVAFLYASVGHGGASGYLALMALYGITPSVMKPTALLLNLFVSAIAFIQFYRGGYFRRDLFVPLAVASVPLAFVGGLLHINATAYKTILGLLLVIIIIRFLFFSNFKTFELKRPVKSIAFILGGIIGFLSGLIGIGGGIILSPVLLLLRWADIKQAAAISALFIFVNSVAGLTGQVYTGVEFSANMIAYVMVAFAGGLAGAYFGSLKFRAVALRNLLAVVLMVAAWKLLFTNA